jgi:hypothetical protein
MGQELEDFDQLPQAWQYDQLGAGMLSHPPDNPIEQPNPLPENLRK